MSYASTCDGFSNDRRWGPWTLAGGADPDFSEVDRNAHHMLLTDPQLFCCFRRHFPDRGQIDYDEMVRCLDYVWDCPDDATANVTGYRCGSCGRTRAKALPESARSSANRDG
jgi:hypothetical protein